MAITLCSRFRRRRKNPRKSPKHSLREDSPDLSFCSMPWKNLHHMDRRRRPFHRPAAYVACSLLLLAGCALTPEELEEKGDRLMAQGHASRAISAYFKAQKKNPENHEVGWKIAQIQQKRGMIDDAILRYEALLEQDPDMHNVRLALAELQVQKGLWIGANRNVTILNKVLPLEVKVIKLQALIARHNRDPILALSLWRVAAQLDPSDPTVQHSIGTVYLERGDYELAAAALRRANRADPEYTEADFELGLALIELNLIDEAERAYRCYIDTHQRDEKAYYRLGNALYSKGYVSRAITQYERAISIKPDYAEAHFNLGMAFVQTKQRSRARMAFQQVLKWTNREEYRESARRMLSEPGGG